MVPNIRGWLLKEVRNTSKKQACALRRWLQVGLSLAMKSKLNVDFLQIASRNKRKRHGWTQESLEEAIGKVKSGELTEYRASQ